MNTTHSTELLLRRTYTIGSPRACILQVVSCSYHTTNVGSFHVHNCTLLEWLLTKDYTYRWKLIAV